ncbi:hypothetical protein DIPPA_26232 [Diplonema papillatum]|nr:hypothetical protein DIPPA_26232 [Diplonema papillatum]
MKEEEAAGDGGRMTRVLKMLMAIIGLSFAFTLGVGRALAGARGGGGGGGGGDPRLRSREGRAGLLPSPPPPPGASGGDEVATAAFEQRAAAGCENHRGLTIATRAGATLDACFRLCLAPRPRRCAAVNYGAADGGHEGTCVLLADGCVPEDAADWDYYRLTRKTPPGIAGRPPPPEAKERGNGPGVPKKAAGAPRTSPQPKHASREPAAAAGTPDGERPACAGGAEPRRSRATAAADLHEGAVVALRSVASARCLSLPYYSAAGRGSAAAGLLRLRKHGGGWALQSLLGGYLAAETNHKLSMDRRAARSMEQFSVAFPGGGGAATAVLHGARAKRFVTAARPGKGSTGGGFFEMAATTQDDPAAQFDVFLVDCRWPGADEGEAKPRDVSLWKHVRELAGSVVLFTSPKPVRGGDEASVRAAKVQRMVFENWARLPRVAPMIVAEDDSFNADAKRLGFRLAADAILHPTFKQPTYASLFQAAWKAADATSSDLVMYSNSDLLYTTTLTETLDAVLAHRKLSHPGAPLLLIGRRTNVNADPDVDLASNSSGAQWAERVEELERAGVLFQPDAEDYFLASRDAYDWGSMPDFVVGGAAFDNWFVSAVLRQRNVLVVDVTRTVAAVHLNHDSGKKCGLKCSLATPKSAYNTKLAHQFGGTRAGTTNDCEYATVRTLSGIRVLRREEFFV